MRRKRAKGLSTGKSRDAVPAEVAPVRGIVLDQLASSGGSAGVLAEQSG